MERMAPITEVRSSRELPDDGLVAWAAQRFGPAVRAWRSRDAVAVASRDLSTRDRLVVRGSPGPVSRLVRHAFAEVGPSLRPLGDPQLIRAVCERVPGLGPASAFGWMQTDTAPAPDGRAGVLGDADRPEVADLLDAAFPGSYARPGAPGVRRWWGVRDARTGRLVAVTADAWSAPTVGFVAGVATRGSARGQGLGRAVVATAVHRLVGDHGRVALMVDADNAAARRVYASLGLAWHDIAATGLAVRPPTGRRPVPVGRGGSPSPRSPRSSASCGG